MHYFTSFNSWQKIHVVRHVKYNTLAEAQHIHVNITLSEYPSCILWLDISILTEHECVYIGMNIPMPCLLTIPTFLLYGICCPFGSAKTLNSSPCTTGHSTIIILAQQTAIVPCLG